MITTIENPRDYDKKTKGFSTFLHVSFDISRPLLELGSVRKDFEMPDPMKQENFWERTRYDWDDGELILEYKFTENDEYSFHSYCLQIMKLLKKHEAIINAARFYPYRTTKTQYLVEGFSQELR